MTTVGAIVGLGLATDALNYETIAWILSWWIFAPIAGFWIGATIGRYIYSDLSRRVQIETSEGPLFVLDHGRGFQSHPSAPTRPGVKSGTAAGVVVIGCYMAFSAGANNVPNAAAPLVSGGDTDGGACDTHCNVRNRLWRIHYCPQDDGIGWERSQ